jgi:type III restriction enzyme
MARMNPLCNLRYSATPKQAHHMVFKLDAVDAYERKLVKQIEVAAASVEGGHNKAYLRLLSMSNRRGVIRATVEVDAQTATGVQRREITVQDGDDLEMTTGRVVYRDCRVGEIRVARNDEFLELRFPGGEQYLRPGQAYGDVDALAVQRQMIHRTIKEHLDKKSALSPQSRCSVCSSSMLSKNWQHADGNPVKGDYAWHLRGGIRRLAKHPNIRPLQESGPDHRRRDVHNATPIDRKKVWQDS